MKHIRSIFALILIIASFVILGCNTTRLESGGAYAPVDTNGVPTQAADVGLYLADSGYKVAHDAIDLVFSLEYTNRATLWKLSPNIKHELDRIRPQANEANQDYLRARHAYMLNPTPANLDALGTILGRMSQLASATQAFLPQMISKP